MALANFFDKAALAASQVLKGIDYSSFASAVESEVVGLAFDNRASGSPEARITLELSVNLMARLYPRIAITALDAIDNWLADKLIAIARSINPQIDVATQLDSTASCLVVGETPAEIAVPVEYIGSDGWIVRVSPHAPVGSGKTTNPFGACAAACFGAANVFRTLFRAYLSGGVENDAFSMSLLDYEPNSGNPANPELVPVDLGESYLVGLGAIGNGAVFALAKMSGLRGVLHIVDQESVELSNLQRYVLATQTAVDIPKVLLAARALDNSGLHVRPHQDRWGHYLRASTNWNLERVAVAVDSREDRCAIQASLPRWIVNAWTQPGDLGISRHTFLGDQACLMCLYLPEARQKGEDQIVAGAIGCTDDIKKVAELLYTGEPVGREFIERISRGLGIPTEALLSFETIPLRAFYSKVICGGIALRLGSNGSTSSVEVPMAFQSALAGVMLAAELVTHAGALKQAPSPVTTRIDLLRSQGSHLSLDNKKSPSGYCICQDVDYVTAYKAKYGTRTSTSRV